MLPVPVVVEDAVTVDPSRIRTANWSVANRRELPSTLRTRSRGWAPTWKVQTRNSPNSSWPMLVLMVDRLLGKAARVVPAVFTQLRFAV